MGGRVHEVVCAAVEVEHGDGARDLLHHLAVLVNLVKERQPRGGGGGPAVAGPLGLDWDGVGPGHVLERRGRAAVEGGGAHGLDGADDDVAEAGLGRGGGGVLCDPDAALDARVGVDEALGAGDGGGLGGREDGAQDGDGELGAQVDVLGGWRHVQHVEEGHPRDEGQLAQELHEHLGAVGVHGRGGQTTVDGRGGGQGGRGK